MAKDNRKLGPGGAPTRCTTLPEAPEERKKFPVASGVLDYFPDAIAALSYLSYKGNEQHNPGQSLRWTRSKSGDEADTMLRHFLQRGTVDTDGVRHSVKMAWRALALLQKEIEASNRLPRVGDRVVVKAASYGALGAENLTGVLVPEDTPITSGLSCGLKVRVGRAVWGLGLDGVVVLCPAE